MTRMPAPALLLRSLATPLLVLLATLPHVTYLPPLIPAFGVLTFLTWALALGRGGTPPHMHTWGRLLLLALGLGTVGQHFGQIAGRDPGIAFFTFLMFLKLWEYRPHRDGMLLTLLTAFQLVTGFIHHQDLSWALYGLLVGWLQLLSLFLHARPASLPPLSLEDAAVSALRLLLPALPMTVLMFTLFPRLSGPLWLLPDSGPMQARTGLSDTLDPGRFNHLTQSGEVAFRVIFDDPAPPFQELYWRGLVLWELNGETWQGADTFITAPPGTSGEVRLRLSGPTVRHQITLEPHGRSWLFALDRPVEVPVPARMGQDMQLRLEHTLLQPLRYPPVSVLAAQDHTADPFLLAKGLALPESGNPRARALAAQWVAASATPRELMDTARKHFIHGGFAYTLDPPPMPKDSVDALLFTHRAGFCSHYAAAMTFLMRAAGLPARLVLGYMGGRANGDHMTVLQADAHAWSEVWLPDAGWMRVDPTLWVAPERVRLGAGAVAGAEERLTPLLPVLPESWNRRLWQLWDRADQRWNQWVVGYDHRRQRGLMASLGLSDADPERFALQLGAAMALVIALMGALHLWRLTRDSTDPAQRLYGRLCARLTRAGLPRAPHEGPQDYARRASAAFPRQAAALDAAFELYIAARYAANPAADTLSRLGRAVARLHLKPLGDRRLP
ncbi:MAG: DUF3488 and transglutaminase-like domain-containing protein [Magnetococcus sp. WYHC-3]